MFNRKNFLFATLILVLSMILAACGGEAPAPVEQAPVEEEAAPVEEEAAPAEEETEEEEPLVRGAAGGESEYAVGDILVYNADPWGKITVTEITEKGFVFEFCKDPDCNSSGGGREMYLSESDDFMSVDEARASDRISDEEKQAMGLVDEEVTIAAITIPQMFFGDVEVLNGEEWIKATIESYDEDTMVYKVACADSSCDTLEIDDLNSIRFPVGGDFDMDKDDDDDFDMDKENDDDSDMDKDDDDDSDMDKDDDDDSDVDKDDDDDSHMDKDGEGETKAVAGCEPLSAVSADVANYFNLMNKYRDDLGLPCLKMSEKLNEAAQVQADYLAENNISLAVVGREAHKGHDGTAKTTICDRQFDVAYYGAPPNENICQGVTTPQDALECWQKSQGHNDTLTDKKGPMLYTGVAVVTSSNGGAYWVQTFNGEAEDSMSQREMARNCGGNVPGPEAYRAHVYDIYKNNILGDCRPERAQSTPPGNDGFSICDKAFMDVDGKLEGVIADYKDGYYTFDFTADVDKGFSRFDDVKKDEMTKE